MVGLPMRLGVKRSSAAQNQIVLADNCRYVKVGHSVWQEDEPCCWSTPAPALINAISLYIPPICRARSPYLYPPGTGWFSCTPRYLVKISSLSTNRRATVELLEPASTREPLAPSRTTTLGADHTTTMLPTNFLLLRYLSTDSVIKSIYKNENKAIPLTGCEILGMPHFLDSRLTDGCEVVNLMHPPLTAPQKHLLCLSVVPNSVRG
jgi:hypothetical protein